MYCKGNSTVGRMFLQHVPFLHDKSIFFCEQVAEKWVFVFVLPKFISQM